MTQITRCPVCQTMFKVVADQLNAAQGWVRCGCCGEVFDAALHGASPIATDIDAPNERAQDGEKNVPEIPMQALSVDVSLPISSGPKIGQAEDIQIHDSADIVEIVPEVPEVSFVRDARHKAFWKKSLVRSFLGLLSLALLTVLLLQWVLQQKDNLAAMDSRLVPFLQTLCTSLDCEIRPPRRIESVVIDSSNFSKISPDVYHLSFVLKNTSAIKLEIPSVEITLTDAQEQALVRRVVTPAQFGVTAVSLAAHTELTGMVTLKASADEAELTPASAPASASASAPAPASTPSALPATPLPINGYRILAFYP